MIHKSKPQKLKLRYFEQSLRFPVAFLFLMIFLAILAENIFAHIGFETLTPIEWILTGSGFLILFILEIIEAFYYPRRIYFLLGLLLTGLRVIAVYAITLGEPTGLSAALAGYIFFSMCFHFHPLIVLPVLLIYLYDYYLGFGVNFHIKIYQLGFLYEFSSFIMFYLFGVIIRWDDRIRRRNLTLSKQLEAYASYSISVGKQEERLRIARDLHDSLGHQLVAANIQLQKAAAYQEVDLEESRTAIQNSQQAINQAMSELRQTIKDLREDEEKTEPITDLKLLLEKVSQNALNLRYTINGSAQGYPELTLMMLKQLIQEGLTNIQKHALASNAEVKLKFLRTKIQVELHDDGVGFNPKKIDQTEHFGIKTMQERVQLVGGTIKINSKPGQGTKIFIDLPKEIYG